jgi:hypothetical protein
MAGGNVITTCDLEHGVGANSGCISDASRETWRSSMSLACSGGAADVVRRAGLAGWHMVAHAALRVLAGIDSEVAMRSTTVAQSVGG